MNRAAANLKFALVRLLVRETLARRILDCEGRTFPIIEAEPDSVIVAEVKLRQVTVQVLLCA